MKIRIAIAAVLFMSVAAWGQQPAPAPSSGESSSKTGSKTEGPKALEADKPLYQEADETPVEEVKQEPVYNSSVIAPIVEGGTTYKHPVLTPSFQFVQSIYSGESTV